MPRLARLLLALAWLVAYCHSTGISGDVWCQVEVVVDDEVVALHGLEATIGWVAIALDRIGSLDAYGARMRFRVARRRVVSALSTEKASFEQDLENTRTMYSVVRRNCMTILISSKEHKEKHGIADTNQHYSILCSTTQFAIVYLPKRNSAPWSVRWVEFVAAIEHEALHVLGATHDCGNVMDPVIAPDLYISGCTRSQILALQRPVLSSLANFSTIGYGTCFSTHPGPAAMMPVPVQPVWLDSIGARSVHSYTVLTVLCVIPQFFLLTWAITVLVFVGLFYLLLLT